MTIESPKPTLTSIQILRGIAATMVVLLHIGAMMDRLQLGRVAHPTFGAGVDVFFVISGFIMWYTTANRLVTPSSFIMNRMVRIVPLYWALTTALVTAMAVLPSAFQNSSLSVRHVLTSYLFIPYPDKAGNMWPVLIPGWTLNYEMFFYLIFAGTLLIRGRSTRAFAIVVILALLVVIPAITGQPNGLLSFYTNPIILEFAFGVVIGEVFLRWRPRAVWAWGIVAAIGAACLALGDPTGVRALVWGVPALLIVAGALFAPTVRFAPLERLGDASYSLYLTHPLTLSVIGLAVRRLHLPWWTVPPFALLVCILIGYATFRLIEEPITRVLKHITRSRLSEPPQYAS
jgi:exopolysaccharide production protein ExoZ